MGFTGATAFYLGHDFMIAAPYLRFAEIIENRRWHFPNRHSNFLSSKKHSVSSAARFRNASVRQVLKVIFEHESLIKAGVQNRTLREILYCIGVKTQCRRPGGVHTAYHSGEKLRYTLEKSAPWSEALGVHSEH